MRDAVLFDLDDTLIVEDGAAAATFRATAASVGGLDAARLAADARECARELWRGRAASIARWPRRSASAWLNRDRDANRAGEISTLAALPGLLRAARPAGLRRSVSLRRLRPRE